MSVAKAIFVIGVIWAVAFAWIFRYETLIKTGNVDVVRLDRWTGAMESCSVYTCLPYDSKL